MFKDNIKFSVIIPLYNESYNIEILIKEIHHYLKQINNITYEVILINDNSFDNTLEIIKEIEKRYRNIVIFSHKENKGQSASILTGIKLAQYDHIITIDGDGQNDPKDLNKMIFTYFSDDNLKLLGGLRLNRQDSVIKILSSKIANSIRSFVLKDNCSDTGCSLKIFDKNIFLDFPFFNGIHRFLPALFLGYGYKTEFITVSHRKRLHGISNYGTLKRLFNGIIDIYKVMKIIKNK